MSDYSQSNQIYGKNRKSWAQQQDNVLNKLVKKHGPTRWTQIARQMTEMYQITNKSAKQCRQRWVNHLNPQINKLEWTFEEQKTIIESHKTYGNKWKLISKLLKNRTDNSIKNHFYSILRKGLRRIKKILGDRRSTQKIKYIRTSVLSKLSKMNNSSIKTQQNQKKKLTNFNIYDLLFQFSWMKAGNISQKNLSQNMKNCFHQMINQLMELSNHQKLIKEHNILQNKQKKYRNSSDNLQKSSNQSDPNINNSKIIQQEYQNKQEIEQNIQTRQTYQKNNMNLSHNFQMLRQQLEYEPLLLNFETISSLKKNQSLSYESQKSKQNQHIVVEINIQNQQQNIEQFNVFPIININIQEQGFSLNQSKDAFNFNQFCFNTSPLYGGKNIIDQIMTRTPRINSPGAFNLYGSGNMSNNLLSSLPMLSNKDKQHLNSESQYDKIIQELRTSINTNSTNRVKNDLKVNSSKNNQNKSSFVKFSLSPKAC